VWNVSGKLNGDKKKRKKTERKSYRKQMSSTNQICANDPHREKTHVIGNSRKFLHGLVHRQEKKVVRP